MAGFHVTQWTVGAEIPVSPAARRAIHPDNRAAGRVGLAVRCRIASGGRDVLAGFLDDQVRILLGQLPVSGIAGLRAFHSGQFVRRDMPGVILAHPASIEVIGASPRNGESFPAPWRDGSDLFQELGAYP
jgi:hypothetical protein